MAALNSAGAKSAVSPYLLLPIVLLLISTSPFCNCQTLQSDKDALILFSSITDTEGRLGWSTLTATHPCGEPPWPGISCSQSRVRTINVSSRGLRGSIPASLSTIPTLEVLNLSNNNLEGTIPASLGNLPSLQSLDLSNNTLTGPIPPELGNLVNLTELVLSGNALNGSIPFQLVQLKKLESLTLNSNSLTGGIPLWLGELKALQRLDLQNNTLDSVIPPQLGRLTQLLSIQLDLCNLSGPIPASLGDLTNLTFLSLTRNGLTGSIPPELGNLRKLTRMALSNNQLSGQVPQALGRLISLLYLDLSNNLLNGSIPSTIANLVNLEEMYIQANRLSGFLPQIASLKNLRTLYIRSNSLSGSFPENATSLLRLTLLVMADNLFAGPLPSRGSLAKFKDIVLADISGNYFNGSLDSSILPNVLLADNNCLVGTTVPQRSTNSCSKFYACLETTIKRPEDYISCAQAASTQPKSTKTTTAEGNNNVLLTAIVPAAAGVVVLLAMAAAALLLWYRLRNRSRQRDAWDKFNGLRQFQFKELQLATRHFSTRLGGGGSADVFRGHLGGRDIAVKRLKALEMRHTSSDEFLREVATLGQLAHVNLVNLLGYSCDPNRPQMLVYEFITGGTLKSLLQEVDEGRRLDFKGRMEVALGIARGIEYCHHSIPEPMVHRDIKPDNILMTATENNGWLPKISDFGLAKIMREGVEHELSPEDTPTSSSAKSMGQTERSTAVAGTRGYIDPEYYLTHRPTLKSDVYSFGMLLLELLLGLRPAQIYALSLVESLSLWLSNLLEKGDAEVYRLVQTTLGMEVPDRDVCIAAMKIVQRCLQEDSSKRPSMRGVVRWLETGREVKGESELTWTASDTKSSGRLSGVMAVHPTLGELARQLRSNESSPSTGGSKGKKVDGVALQGPEQEKTKPAAPRRLRRMFMSS